MCNPIENTGIRMGRMGIPKAVTHGSKVSVLNVKQHLERYEASSTRLWSSTFSRVTELCPVSFCELDCEIIIQHDLHNASFAEINPHGNIPTSSQKRRWCYCSICSLLASNGHTLTSLRSFTKDKPSLHHCISPCTSF